MGSVAVSQTRNEPPCIVFTNTLAWRNSGKKQEHLANYKDLIKWSRESGLTTPGEADRLSEAAERLRGEEKQAYKKAIGLRETLYKVFSSMIEGEAPRSIDLALLNDVLHEAFNHLELKMGSTRLELGLRDKEIDLDSISWRVALSASELLTGDNVNRVKKCASEECGWLFLDTSKNRSRRWCDMKDCGNRMKARRHYVRRKAHGGVSGGV